MAMMVRTNVGTPKDKGKKTKTVTTTGKTTEVTIKKATPATPTAGGQTYKKADERTGAPSYGKESKTKPTPDFVKAAQDKKQTIVEKGGKKFRAGEHTELKVGRQGTPSPSIKVKLPGMVTTKEVPVVAAKNSGKRKIKRLKPMSMTYGTTNNKTDRGGTKYVNKSRPKR